MSKNTETLTPFIESQADQLEILAARLREGSARLARRVESGESTASSEFAFLAQSATSSLHSVQSRLLELSFEAAKLDALNSGTRLR